MNGPMRLRQHGTLFSFAQNICTKCKCFVQKTGIFRPAGGEIRFRVSDRVTRVDNKVMRWLRWTWRRLHPAAGVSPHDRNSGYHADRKHRQTENAENIHGSI